MATQGHKSILSDFLELEDQTASSYQGCISRASVGKWIGYFPSKDSDDREEMKKSNKLSSISLGGLLESFETYPTQYC